MHIGILSRNASLYSTARLVQAGKRRDHHVAVVDYLRAYMDITSARPEVILRGNRLSFDAVIPRIGASHTFYGTSVVRQFEMMGTPTANGSVAIEQSRDKLHSMQLLAHAGVPMPVTGFAHNIQDIDLLLEAVGGPPVVIKLLEGTQGLGVVLAETRKAAESVIGAFRQLDANILVQEYIEESDGADTRVIVVGGQAVAAMRRIAPVGEFRSNLHRGAKAVPVDLTPEEQKLAVDATRIMGLGVAGVDLLQADRGPVVLEVNSSPGLEGIENTTGIDVADRIIEWLEVVAEVANGQ
ncbi:MAG: 30S ribosomal protein S6--L-glutamate ligase [Acidimicrobiia bacterium]|nr:30S ribosomal protein S6--L-glutamate ligase [Acidimicrobiia bacterium]MDH5421529.1 30S ribosomal protein S6--L-glutamate ligase [Acidimicrobiia bacterium]MDH5502815.1 30S ribosomal protein S6--L-glutamate ligase [Acidimicrobiia bacterium]